MKLKSRLEKIEKELAPSFKDLPIPHDYFTNPQSRAEFATAHGINPEVYEKARNEILLKYGGHEG
jgi:hypothetical protein